MLRPNAIIKGQRARYQQYHLQYSPGLDMEHKIREFEAQMGIPAGGGIPIKYARQGETFGSINLTCLRLFLEIKTFWFLLITAA